MAPDKTLQTGSECRPLPGSDIVPTMGYDINRDPGGKQGNSSVQKSPWPKRVGPEIGTIIPVVDGHQPRMNSAHTPSGCQIASMSARAFASSHPSTSRRYR